MERMSSETPKKKARMGREPKLTPEMQEKITNLIRAGHYMETAAKASGIGTTTFWRWMAEGQATEENPRPRPIYRDFREAVQKAEADSEAILLAGIIRDGGPKMKLEVLKRRFPERWGDRHRLEHSGPNGGPIEGHSTGGNAPVVNVILEGGTTWEQPAADDDALEEFEEEEDDGKLTGPPPL